ncbi:hypothetical protein H257_02230 [Aphanomyces astaci]|uniref:Intimal thickness related receptor IRP domain-containing protein n=1 Tax=Aphanomyces astaci TaxID=112090 RepID=W4H7K8_APHAT|nr:hypothetical protein H257_02230 [Aphanomyces astaci]ETV87284.1 hypothetical protein H257_02230 [Aphanomyces astaci]|eukprot:XP_009824083.1 hypothetical protein H257_02230 [Aphanomyces astaci]
MDAVACVVFGCLWLLALGAWGAHCYQSSRFVTELHEAMTLTATLGVFEMGVRLMLGDSTSTWVYVWLVAGCHALFLVSFFATIMLVANGYTLTLPTLRPRDWARILLIACVLGLVRWVRSVADSFAGMLVELTLQFLVLLYVLQACSLNVHFSLFLVALLRREGLGQEVAVVEPSTHLFKQCQIAFSCFFMGYMAICAWSLTILQPFRTTFFLLEQSLLLGLATYFGFYLRPDSKSGLVDVAQHLNVSAMSDSFLRVRSNLNAPEEMRPLVTSSSVVVIENPPSRTPAGRFVPNFGVGVAPSDPHPPRDIQ